MPQTSHTFAIGITAANGSVRNHIWRPIRTYTPGVGFSAIGLIVAKVLSENIIWLNTENSTPLSIPMSANTRIAANFSQVSYLSIYLSIDHISNFILLSIYNFISITLMLRLNFKFSCCLNVALNLACSNIGACLFKSLILLTYSAC